MGIDNISGVSPQRDPLEFLSSNQVAKKEVAQAAIISVHKNKLEKVIDLLKERLAAKAKSPIHEGTPQKQKEESAAEAVTVTRNPFEFLNQAPTNSSDTIFSIQELNINLSKLYGLSYNLQNALSQGVVIPEKFIEQHHAALTSVSQALETIAKKIPPHLIAKEVQTAAITFTSHLTEIFTMPLPPKEQALKVQALIESPTWQIGGTPTLRLKADKALNALGASLPPAKEGSTAPTHKSFNPSNLTEAILYDLIYKGEQELSNVLGGLIQELNLNASKISKLNKFLSKFKLSVLQDLQKEPFSKIISNFKKYLTSWAKILT